MAATSPSPRYFLGSTGYESLAGGRVSWLRQEPTPCDGQQGDPWVRYKVRKTKVLRRGSRRLVRVGVVGKTSWQRRYVSLENTKDELMSCN